MMDVHDRSIMIAQIARSVADSMVYPTALDADRALYAITTRGDLHLSARDKIEIITDALKLFRD